jgi:hypothetical protein
VYTIIEQVVERVKALVGMYQDQLTKHVGEGEAARVISELYVDKMG